MKRKLFYIFTGIVVVGIVVGSYYLYNKKNNENITAINTGMIKYENNNEIDNSSNSDDLPVESNLDKKYPVEDGFKTTIKGGANDDEIISNNLLLKESKILIQDRLEAKRIAENFVQALASFDKDDKNKYMNIALKYTSDDIKKIVESYFSDVPYEKMKGMKITKLRTEERINQDGNDYLYFKVIVSRELIDEYGQESKAEAEKDLVKLLKVNDEYKIVDFRAD